jgi:hypothetical protein
MLQQMPALCSSKSQYGSNKMCSFLLQFFAPTFDCMQALCLSQLSSRQPIPQDALLLRHKASSSSSGGGKRSSSVAAAAARHPAATAVAAVKERIEEKELHVEASEAYLAVSYGCCTPGNQLHVINIE